MATTTTIAINGGLNWTGNLDGGDDSRTAVTMLLLVVVVVMIEGDGDGDGDGAHE